VYHPSQAQRRAESRNLKLSLRMIELMNTNEIPYVVSQPNRKLVIDGRRLTSGRTGVGRYLECLLTEWAQSGLPAEQVLVALADPSGIAHVPITKGLTSKVVAPHLPGLLWERFGLLRLLDKNDLLFAPTNLVPWGWTGATVLVMFDALQELRPNDFSHLLRLRFGARYRKSLQSALRVIVPSLATARDLKRVYGISSDRLTVIHPAPDRSFRPLPSDHPDVILARETIGLADSPFFLFVGKKSRRRNIAAIQKAFDGGIDRFPDHFLVFVGERARHPEMDSGVIDAGHVSEPVLRGLMASATALLYPSELEGFGLPIVEAMAAGCPVITLRRDALIEAGGEGPLYLETAEPRLLEEAMVLMASDPEARAVRVQAGLEAASRHSMEEFAAAVMRELQQALNAVS
jgi:glycosyltransferase involved in cell wall biosynthesis